MNFAGFVGLVITVQSSRSMEKTNEINALQELRFRFIQQRPILISAFAGFVAILLTRSRRSHWEFSYKSTTYKYRERHHGSTRLCS
jgi:hypothetical protein